MSNDTDNSLITRSVKIINELDFPIALTVAVKQRLESKIPAEFSHTDSVYDKISVALKTTLKLSSANKHINYIDLRRMMMEYLNTNHLIIESKINLVSPFLYNGLNTIQLNEVNEWIYTLLLEDPVKATIKYKKITTNNLKKESKQKQDIKSDSDNKNRIITSSKSKANVKVRGISNRKRKASEKKTLKQNAHAVSVPKVYDESDSDHIEQNNDILTCDSESEQGIIIEPKISTPKLYMTKKKL